MRALIVFALLSCFAGSSHAVSSVWRSSHTVSAETTKSLCGQSATSRCTFHGVRVGHGTSGTITIYNSQGSATNPFQVIFTSVATVVGGYDYDVTMSSGCTYSTTAAQSVNFLYSCQ